MGIIRRSIKKLLGWGDPMTSREKYVRNNAVVFTRFGNSYRASDIVRTAIYRVAEEVSKCAIKSVVERGTPTTVTIQEDDINGVLRGRVNPICGIKDFLFKVAYLTLVNKNCMIYWAYDETPIEMPGGEKYVKRVTRGFYPIERARVRIYGEKTGELRAEITGDNGEVLDLPYSDLIHIRLHYGADAYLGGEDGGDRDTSDLLKNLQTFHVIREAIPKNLELGLGLKGVLSMKTVADADKKTVSRDEFESHLMESKSGIVVTDYEADFTPVNIPMNDIPTNVMEFIRTEILAPFGVSLPIYQGKYTDDEYTAFYQTAVEGLLQEIAEAMTVTLFTPRQLAFGHRIKFYDKLVQSLSFARRQEICEMTKDDALLSRDERRELLGYEPDGEPTRMSLNYIDTTIANEYQMQKIQGDEKNGNGNPNV